MFGVLRTLPLTFKKLETIQLSLLIKILEVSLGCKYRNTGFSGLFQAASGFRWVVTGCFQTYFSENFYAKLCQKMTKWDLLLSL